MIAKIKKIFLSSTSRDSFISLAGSAGMAAGGMVFTILMARSLDPAQFGIFSALTATVILLASIGDFGLSSSLINFLPKLPNNRKEIISVIFWSQLTLAIILASLLLLASSFKDVFIPGSTLIQFIAISILVFVYIMEEFPMAVLQADKKFVPVAIFRLIDSFIKVTILSLLFIGSKVTIELGIAATFVSAGMVAFLATRMEIKNIRPFFPKVYFKKIFHFTKWIALNRTFGVAVSRVDIILLTALSSPFAAGIFSAAARFALVLTLIVSSLGNVTTPRFSVFNNKQQIKNYIKKLLGLITLIVFAAAILAIFAKPLILFVFGSEYSQAIPVFQALTVAMIPFIYSIATTGPLIYSFNKPNFVAAVTIIQVTILIVLDLILIPIYGVFAPPIALGASNLLVLIITGLKLKYLLK